GEDHRNREWIVFRRRFRFNSLTNRDHLPSMRLLACGKVLLQESELAFFPLWRAILQDFCGNCLQKRKRPRCFRNVAFVYAGNDLLSHTLSRAVQSARRGLTSVFGMGTGGSPAVRSPTS